MNTLFAVSTLILSGGQVVLGLAALGTAIYLGIFAAKTYLRQQSEKVRGEEIKQSSSVLRKYEAVDIQQHAKNIKLAGFASAVAIVLIIFAWTQFTSEQVLADFFIEPEAIEMDVPPTAHEPKRLPALPPPPVQENPTQIDVVDKPEPIDEPEPIVDPVDISPPPSDYTGPTSTESDGLPPVIDIEPEPEEPADITIEKTFIHVEQMPRFPGCEEYEGNNDAKKVCADQRLLAFIYDNIKYPSMARENNIEGTAVISFVINKKGLVEDIKVLRDPGGGCGKEAARIIKMMNKMSENWTPGKQRGRAVKVRYNLPVKFRLNG